VLWCDAQRMNERPEPPIDPAAAAERQLAGLSLQVKAMRGVLTRLLQDVARAELQRDSSQVTQLKQANEQLALSALDAQSVADRAAGALDVATRSAGLDPLTGLPNRALMLDRVEHALSSARRNGHRVGLLFLDLNNFKSINDNFGHAAGDRALQLVADCLSSLLRESDTVSRHGGDEFLIVLADVNHAANAAVIAEKVNVALARHSEIDHLPVCLTASIGISIYPEDGADCATLIERADAAMYVAKRHERGGYAFHATPSAAQQSAGAPSKLPLTSWHYQEWTVAEHERRHALLVEANEQLVLAALHAHELLAAERDRRSHAT